MPKASRKKNENGVDELVALAESSLTTAQRAEIKKHTLEEKAGICYGVDIRGRLGLIYAGLKKVSKGYQFQFTNYPFYRIVYTVSGFVTVNSRKQSYTSESGTIFSFVPREPSHIINNSDVPWVHMYVHFTGQDAARMYKETMLSSKRIAILQNPLEIQQIFESLVSESILQDEHSQMVCDSYLLILLLKLSSQNLQGSPHIEASKITYLQCRNYINANFSHITGIGEVAEEHFIDKVHLCRLFRRYAGVSPMEYILKMKTNKAALLLIQTDYPIKQISHMLNFSDPYYFSRVFKRMHGISPAHYRKCH